MTNRSPVRAAPASAPLEAPTTRPAWVPTREQLEISEGSYRWTARLFRLLERVLRVNLKLHEPERIGAGEIFLFNHFARFETFIPQYFIYQECGAFSRSIASGEFFRPQDPFSDYLLSVGAVPNGLPDLLPFLAGEALRGRRIIVFPEGGMVKDRRVVDERGRYSVYSRTAQARRKHHAGAAVLALGLDLFKCAVLDARERGEDGRLEALAASVDLPVAEVLAAVRPPTVVVPSNITFYPIRVGENLLSKGAELMGRGLSRRLSEELLIEGNILLEHTDMDIRLGVPVRVRDYWRWWERPLPAQAARHIASMEEAFAVRADRGPRALRLYARSTRRSVERIRDDYMHRMYVTVSVNLSHLASALMLELLDHGQARVERARFHLLLYQAVKAAQGLPDIHLHRSLRNPESYGTLPEGECEALQQLVSTAARMDLLSEDDGGYRFLPKLREEHHFDVVRLENLVEVYANEIMPLHRLRRALRQVVKGRQRHDPRAIALARADDEAVAWRFDAERFSRERYREQNALETASEPGEPYLLEGDGGRAVGVVLVHGFLASPAEMRGLAQMLNARGHTVYAARLKGHGTSPWDLFERGYEDWLASVSRAVRIVAGLSDRVVVVGFSTGGSLALHLAGSAAGQDLAGVCAVCVPVRFQNPHMRFVPLVHGANRLVQSLSTLDGVMPFTLNDSENPHINYRHMPVRALYELRRLVEAMLERLGEVRRPVCLIQATRDPVVVPDSVDTLLEGLTQAPVSLHRVESERHGLIAGDVADTRERIAEFVAGL
jgi:esterase/lipase